MAKKISAATKRAAKYYQTCEFLCDFRYSPAYGLGYEEGVHRRDPSSVIKVGDLYYVWYTKSVGPHYGFDTGDPEAKVWPWDWAEIWYATSPDGIHWTEKGRAVGRGPKGSFDDRTVCTPEILAHEGKYYLVYQCVQGPYRRRTPEVIGMAVASSPDGPWRKVPHPILEPTLDGEWLGDEDNHLLVKKKGSFDSLRVNDPCLFFYKGKFWLYYKGEQMGEGLNIGGRDIKWGVAIADRPEGPYVRSEYNPITNTGHETILWQYKGGIAALLTADGPEKRTIQYAPDGLNFEIVAVVDNPPIAAGPFRPEDPDKHPLEGLRWGLCHVVDKEWNYIIRFDVDETRKKRHLAKQPFP